MASKKRAAKKKAGAKGALTRKITPKTIRDAARAADKLVWEFGTSTILGRVNGTEKADGQYGESTGFLGVFELSLPDGATVKANKCYLPGVAEDLLANACLAQQEAAINDETGEIEPWSIDVAFTITAVEKEKRPDDQGMPYEWEVVPIVSPESADTDPLNELRALAAEAGAA